jgi:putative tricarboxylic transport membrane protein
MEAFQSLMDGFAICFQWQYLMFTILGCLVGTIIGVLPGVGPAAGTAMLLPLTFGMSPIASIIMLSAIYYGAMYGGTITSVLLNVPGEAASAITCLDGYAMAKKGRAGSALAIAAIGSFFGGTVATFGLVLLALPLTRFALKFGPPEFFSLMFVGLSLAVALASKSMVRALIAALIGLLLAMIGIDPVMGVPRFTFGEKSLLDGIGIVPIAMGLFGIGELLLTAEDRSHPSSTRGCGRCGRRGRSSRPPFGQSSGGPVSASSWGSSQGWASLSPLSSPMPWRRRYPRPLKNSARA